MAFQSDRGARRTWDPTTLWELFEVTRGREYQDFELRHPRNPTVRFWGKTLSVENTGDFTSDGRPIAHVVFKVVAVDDHASPRDDARRPLIEEALNAFGTRHDASNIVMEVAWETPPEPGARLITFIVSVDPDTIGEVARDIIGSSTGTIGNEAAEFLNDAALASEDCYPGGEGTQITLKRDPLSKRDAEKFLKDLEGFWSALFARISARPRLSPRQPNAVSPLVGAAAGTFRALSADNVLVVLEGLEHQYAWHIDPAEGGGITIKAFEF